jgi:hypothetical protein
MNKLVSYILVLTLLATNTAVFAQDDCHATALDDAHAVSLVDLVANDKNANDPECDDGVCCHSHASLISVKSSKNIPISFTHNNWISNNYLSLRGIPPFQPPKA